MTELIKIGTIGMSQEEKAQLFPFFLLSTLFCKATTVPPERRSMPTTTVQGKRGRLSPCISFPTLRQSLFLPYGKRHPKQRRKACLILKQK